MLTLHFTNTVQSPFNKSLFTKVLREAEKHLDPIPETELEFALVDDDAIQHINLETRGKDKPTDVLSFANREITDAALRAASADSLGQIVISVPAAERNAEEIGQSLEEELKFLFLHGLLHILGYDHQTPDEEFEMMSLAYRILKRPPFKKGSL